MPFGPIFGSVFFGLLCPILGLRLLFTPGLPSRVAGVLLMALGISLALALLRRLAWARWGGALAAALVLSLFVVQVLARGGTVLDFVMLLAGVATAALLLIPATGDVQLGLPEGVGPQRRRGRVLAVIAGTAVVGLIGVVAWAQIARPLRAGAPAGSGPAWTPSRSVSWAEFGPGLERAREQGKPIFVDFYAAWCAPCKTMDRVTFRDPRVVDLLDEIVAVRVDSDDGTKRHGYSGRELADIYEVDTYPTVALLAPDGRVIARHRGYRGTKPFLAWLEGALDRARRLEGEPIARGRVHAAES